MDETGGPLHRPLILFYNEFFGSAPQLVTRLNDEDRKAFSSDRALFAQADAVVFHVPGLILSTPNLHDFAALRKIPGQMWIAWSMESALNYPILKNPVFMDHFDLLVSYARTADIWSPYLPTRAEWQEALSRPLPAKTAARPVAMFQSHSANRSGRNEYAMELMSRIPVDSYGRFLTNKQLPEADRGAPTKLATIGRYKFCLAFENAVEVDYVTEKFFHPLLAGSVPVYRGAPNVDRFAPGDHAFINANDYPDPAALAAYLKELDRDDDAYRRFFRWRERPFAPSFEADLESQSRPPFARLIDVVRRRRETRGL